MTPILHTDFNSFYASGPAFSPALRRIGRRRGNPSAPRHYHAKNELAKKFGVKPRGDLAGQAEKPRSFVKRICFLSEIFRAGREIYGYSDRVEAFGLDENWIDVSGSTETLEDARRLAETIRFRIRDELGITVSIGVADNKVFAKLGSDIKKPDAVTFISPENYKKVVWPLPAGELLYVGRATQAKLLKYGVLTIGDLANTPV